MMNIPYDTIGYCGFSAAGGALFAGWLLVRNLRNFAWAANDIISEAKQQRDKARRDLEEVAVYMDRFADGTLIASEGPCVTPDGREANIEPFTETPIAVIKYEDGDEREDERFDARDCYPCEVK